MNSHKQSSAMGATTRWTHSLGDYEYAVYMGLSNAATVDEHLTYSVNRLHGLVSHKIERDYDDGVNALDCGLSLIKALC